LALSPKASTAPIELQQAAAYSCDLEHQNRAWQQLQASLSPEQLAAFALAFRNGQLAAQGGGSKTPAAAKPTAQAPAPAQPTSGNRILLPVPYLCQNDSATAQGPRMCFSSSCAMAAAFLRPGCLAGTGQLDDQYLQRVQRHGDTTDAQAQVQTLRNLGIEAELRTDGRIEQLIAQLKLGIPVPVGWLHKGPVTAPSGGGHWSLVIGWEPAQRQLLIHDPNGEADLVGGGYVSTAIGSGKSQRYSERNWGRRWMVEGPGSGWWLELGC
jgi:hypothetical protein